VILFLCLGNICRSPTAEAIARFLRPDLAFDSAGTGGWHAGEPPYAPMRATAAARGLDMSALRARQITAQDFQQCDWIVAMDEQNLADARAAQPAGSRARLTLLLDHAPALGLRDVPDPYYTRDFDAAYDIIEAGVTGFLKPL